MTAIDILNAHVPSITDRVEEAEDGPLDDIGDYIGDTRECACGEIVHGFYEYHSHLVAMLGASPVQERPAPLILTADGSCPFCGSPNDRIQQWANDGEAADADWWECEVCRKHGAFLDPSDPTKTVNGISIKGATA